MTANSALNIDDALFTGIDTAYLDRVRYILSTVTLTRINPLGARNGIVAAMHSEQHWLAPMAWHVDATTVYLSLPWRRSTERRECGLILKLDLTAMDWNPRVIARRRDLMWFPCDQALTDTDWNVPVAHYANAEQVQRWKMAHLEFTCAMLEKLRHAGLWKGEAYVTSIPRSWADFLLEEWPADSRVEIGQIIALDGDIRVAVRCRGKVFVIKHRQAVAVQFDGVTVKPTVLDKTCYQILLNLCDLDSYYTPPLIQAEEITI